MGESQQAFLADRHVAAEACSRILWEKEGAGHQSLLDRELQDKKDEGRDRV